MSDFVAEMQAQAEAFRRMNGNMLELIAEYAEDFRQIIDDFEKMHNRPPSANDLLWIASEHAGRDVTNENGDSCGK